MSIFISIASYRDPKLRSTVQQAYEQALHPDKLRVGVLQQNSSSDKGTGADASGTLATVVTVPHESATGPTTARRFIESTLLGDELFYMVIDSHTSFVRHWDAIAVDQLLSCGVDQPVLTTFPPDVGSETATYTRWKGFHRKLKLPEQERMTALNANCNPVPANGLSAGFIFTLSRLVKTCPYVCLPELFLGEEIIMATRYVKAGWQLFVPSRVIVTHIVDRSYRPIFWSLKLQKMGASSADAMRYQQRLSAATAEVHLELDSASDILQSHFGINLKGGKLSRWARRGFSKQCPGPSENSFKSQ